MNRNLRTLPRLVITSVAWAAVPVLLVAGCSGGGSDSEGSGDATESASDGSGGGSEDQSPSSEAPSPAEVRFTTLPEACSTVDGDTVEQVVPEVDPRRGETIETTDPSLSGTCLWTGLDDYQFRSLTVSLRRFDSEEAIGTGDERAEAYMTRLVEEVTGEDSHEDVETAELPDLGDGGATSIGYRVTKDSDEGDAQRYHEQRVVARTGNVVITVDYSGAGFEDADMPSRSRVRENAETAAGVVLANVDAFADEQPADGGDGQSEGQGEGEGSAPPSDDTSGGSSGGSSENS
ncbi:hypothetical protein ACTWP5_04185 [Streptomyces sp. 4N509B]|uniref:hypothetical protein n=1 Tax=Streptomyces sp. 4N509B TaxID=3457413 RepID=UPI003FD6A918